jgi:dihydroxyacid dehydratase/phosphogluconate dehydratase
VFEAVGACAAGKITEDELVEVEKAACPGAGACGGQFTANTMALALSALGLSPMGLNDIPAVHPDKPDAARKAAGRLWMRWRRTAARATDHADEPEERRRRGHRHGGLNQRRAAPSGHRARGRDQPGPV